MLCRPFLSAACAVLFSAAGWAQGPAPAGGFAPELSQRHGFFLFETLEAVACDAREGGDPLGGARLDHRLGATLSPCTRLRIAVAAASALERGDKVRWRLDHHRLRGAAMPGPRAEGRLGDCRTVRLETYSAHGDMDERTLTLCREHGPLWRVAPAPRRDRFNRSG